MKFLKSLFSKPKSSTDWDRVEEKYQECKEFADVGDKIKYLDQEVYVTYYNKTEHVFRVGTFPKVGIGVEWFNSNKELQKVFIHHHELDLCTKIL